MNNAKSRLVDESVTYCDVSDVERFIRSYEFDGDSDPTESEVQSLIEAATDTIDNKVKATAWRTREVQDYQKEIELSHAQNSPRTAYGDRFGGLYTFDDPWALVRLPHTDIKEITKVEIITDHGTEDITDNEGDDYRVNYRDGMIEPHVGLIRKGNIRTRRPVHNTRRARVRVSYSFGQSTVPADIRDACARLVAVDIAETDTYGAVLPQSDGMGPGDMADRMEEKAMSTIEDYKYSGMMI